MRHNQKVNAYFACFFVLSKFVQGCPFHYDGQHCQIRRNPLTRQATGQRNPHRLPTELLCMLDYLAGLLERALCSRATGAKPVQVHTGDRRLSGYQGRAGGRGNEADGAVARGTQDHPGG